MRTNALKSLRGAFQMLFDAPQFFTKVLLRTHSQITQKLFPIAAKIN